MTGLLEVALTHIAVIEDENERLRTVIAALVDEDARRVEQVDDALHESYWAEP